MQLEPDLQGYFCFLIVGWQCKDMESGKTAELVDPSNTFLHIQYTVESSY